MPTAKSYENMTVLGEPYKRDGKMYVRVQGLCPRCGGTGNFSYNPLNGSTCFRCSGSGKEIKEVRWYTESQRAALDRAAEKRTIVHAAKVEERRVKFAARNAFGFGEEGFITLYKGDADSFFRDRRDENGHCLARYNTIFQWFSPATLPIPADLPETITPIRLNWDDICDPTDEEGLNMRPEGEVMKKVNALICEPSRSVYQGEKNEWLERKVIIKKNFSLDSDYGSSSHLHVMEDADGNVYVWTTASKNLAEGATFTIKMKVKEHKEYNGVQQTVVYYCKVKEN